MPTFPWKEKVIPIHYIATFINMVCRGNDYTFQWYFKYLHNKSRNVAMLGMSLGMISALYRAVDLQGAWDAIRSPLLIHYWMKGHVNLPSVIGTGCWASLFVTELSHVPASNLFPDFRCLQMICQPVSDSSATFIVLRKDNATFYQKRNCLPFQCLLNKVVMITLFP